MTTSTSTPGSEPRRYVRFRGRESGPFTAAELGRMAKRGQLTRMHELSEDREHWVRAGSDAGLFAPLPSTAPSTYATAESAPVEAAAPVSETSTLKLGEQPEWHYALQGDQFGPVTISTLREMHAAGKLGRHDLVWRPGMAEWKELGVAGVIEASSAPAPAAVKQAEPVTLDGPADEAEEKGGDSRAGLALVAMIVSSLGLLTIVGGVALGPLGAGLGIAAMSGMKRSGNRAGHGFAVAALAIGGMALLIGVIAIATGVPGKIAAMVGGSP